MTALRYYPLKLQAQGRVVVPQAVRVELGVQEGDDLLLLKTEQGFQLTTREALLAATLGSLARDDGRDMTQELLDERRAEARAKGW
ncbi:AbrB/MazE/SpoVT family DNA-binding domain-containing protein [Deinococcus radiomollis]|uniref:AbrB/MazE/SpoVT family DNA-binding domain-containing protein n=1 Tax=Deinococcus radiomollis TaxID=468916 RepID=UPI0038925B7D